MLTYQAMILVIGVIFPFYEGPEVQDNENKQDNCFWATRASGLHVNLNSTLQAISKS